MTDRKPQDVLRELVDAVLTWEQADAFRARIHDSKRASEADLEQANVRLVAAIKNLRAVARELRKLTEQSSVVKRTKRGKVAAQPKMPLDWNRIIDNVAKVAGVVKDIKDGKPAKRVIDVTADPN